MFKRLKLLVLISCFSWAAYAEIVIDKESVLRINKESYQAILDGDISIIEKYIYPETKIIIDMDPEKNKGETEISYENYIKMAKATMSMIKNPGVNVDYSEEVLSVSLDEQKNQVTVLSKSTTVTEMMGFKLEDISEDEAVYGIVGDQIKLLRFKNQLISSSPIE